MPNYEMILSRDSYLLAMELRCFWAVAIVYGLSLILFVFQLLTKHIGMGRAARAMLWAAGALGAALVAFRAFEAGRVPVYTGYERLALFACIVTVAYLYSARRFPETNLPGAITSALGFGASAGALLYASPDPAPAAPALGSFWFVMHAALLTFSYAVLTVSAAMEAGSILTAPGSPRPRPEAPGPGALRAYAYRLVQFAFPLLTVAIFSGVVLAGGAFDGYTRLAPALICPLITWTVFAMYLHSMAAPGLRRALAPALNFAGFFSVTGTLIWANWLERLLGAAGLYS